MSDPLYLVDLVDLSYLGDGLYTAEGMRADIGAQVQAVAIAWAKAGIDPAQVEIIAEVLARTAAEMAEEDVARFDDVAPALALCDLPELLTRLLRDALAEPAGSVTLAAIAVHLIDIAESMGLQIFIPELPQLAAKSDRSGDAARMVGVARHLRG